MRILILLSLILSSTISLQARELTISEKLAVITVESASSIVDFMGDTIDTEELTKKDLILLYVLKKSCYPVEKELSNIAEAGEDEMQGRLTYITTYAKACKEGALSITNLFIKYQ